MFPNKKTLEEKYNKPKLPHKARLSGKIDETDVKIAIKAIINNYDDLIALEEKIKKSIEKEHPNKDISFRLIIINLGAIFEMNFEQLGKMFINDQNPELSDFLKEFTNIPSISQEELSDTKKEFTSIWNEIEELAYIIKEDYHKIYREQGDSEFIEILMDERKAKPYGVALMMKGINMTRWFKSEIIPQNNKYPNSLLLRALFYGALMTPKGGIPGLVKMLNERVYKTQEGYVDIGYSLGFYFGMPSMKKFYRFTERLSSDFMYKIMLENAKELIKIGCADIRMLLIDSTEIFGRRDDMDLPAINRDKSTHKMTYRIQLICDPNQIPLIAVTRLGNEIDQSGFISIIDGLLYIKKSAEQYGKEIEFVLDDAGYFNPENLELVRNLIGAKPIFNINPRRSRDLKVIRNLFEKYKKKYYEKLHDASLPIADQIEVLREAKLTIFDRIEEKCWELVQTNSKINKFVAYYILSVGIENFMDIYARRNVIEGFIGLEKSRFLDLTNNKNKILVLGKEKVSVRVLLTLIGIQFKALTNYRILKKQNGVIKDLFWVSLYDILVNYENIPFQEND